MAEAVINNTDMLRSWFAASGVAGPLQDCIGPLPVSGASIVRWTSEKPDTTLQTIPPHPQTYRISLMLEPLESQIWADNVSVWAGTISANSFRICPPGPSAQWRRLGPCNIVNVFIPSPLIDSLGQARGDQHGVLPGSSFTPDRHVLDFVHKLLNAKALAGPLAPQFSDAMVAGLTSYLLENYAHPVAAPKAGGLAGSRLKKILAMIAERLGDDVPVADMADSCAMSESHFSREFRKAVGLPPHQYLMKLRLERAGAALLSSPAPIIEIALDLGFNNVSHFSRAFALHFGVPPSVYRRTHLQH